jgi:hypothetical protein
MAVPVFLPKLQHVFFVYVLCILQVQNTTSLYVLFFYLRVCILVSYVQHHIWLVSLYQTVR